MEIEQGGKSLIGVFTTDTELIVRVWDDAMRSMTGLDANEVVGRKVTEIFPEIGPRGVLRRFEMVRDYGTTEILAPAIHKYLISCPPPEDSRHFAEMRQFVNISALFDNDRIAGLIVVVEDVTARMEREIDLAAQLKDADDGVRLQAAKAISKSNETLHSSDAEPVINALGDKNWRVRRKLVDGLAKRAAPDAVAALLTAVKTEHLDFGILNSALQVLQATSVDTTKTLFEFLRSDDDDLRMQAALALGEHNNPAAVGPLLEALDDENANVRYHVIEALGKLKATVAVGPILAVAESRDFFLSFAALISLEQIGDESAATGVARLLDTEYLRESAAGALGAIGGIDAVDRIAQLLNDGELAAPAVAEAFIQLFDRLGGSVAEHVGQSVNESGASALLAALESADEPAATDIIRTAGWVDDERLRQKLASLMDNENVREAAADALVFHGESAVEHLVEKLQSEDLETAKAAARTLGKFESGRGADALISALHSNPEIAPAALQALGRSESPAAFDALVELLASDDKALRRSVVNALRATMGSDKSAMLCGVLADADANVREAVIRIIGGGNDAECRAAVLAHCDDTDELVRVAALEQLPNFGDENAVSKLAHALGNDVPRVRAAVAQVLGKVGGDESVRALRAALADSDAWARYFAVRSLAALKDAGSIKLFRELSESDDAEQVRVAAAEAVEQVQA